MSNNPEEKYYKMMARFKRRRKMRFVFALIALAIIFAIGGSLLAVLIHLERIGLLESLEIILKNALVSNDLDITYIVFWLILIPVILVIIIVVCILRSRRFKDYRMAWEQTLKYAVEAEKREYIKKKEKLDGRKRFTVLSDITSPIARESGEIQSFEQLCLSFRSFAAAELHLYYTEAQIREFIAGLAISKILILQGMSGTGKTSLAYAFGEFLGNSSTVIPVQPTWKERSDLLGYFNEFTKKYNETPLLKKIYEANGSNQMFIVVLDEMNMARIEYYFAEFLSLLEIPNAELRYLEVVPDVWEDDPIKFKNGRIKLPENMWFVGTVNNDDSTFSISDKVYDRAMILDLETRALPFHVDFETCGGITYDEFTRLLESAKCGYELTRRNERRLDAFDDYLMSKFRISCGNRIMKQIRNYVCVYVACGGDELEALDDILCKKVLRKLAYKDVTPMRNDMKEAIRFLEKLFGAGKMPACREYFARLAKS